MRPHARREPRTRADRHGDIGGRPRVRYRAIRRRRRCPTSCASASKASRQNRSCSHSTSTAWRCTPARRAHRRRSNRRLCWRRWASTPSTPYASRSDGRRPSPTCGGSSTCSRESSNGSGGCGSHERFRSQAQPRGLVRARCTAISRVLRRRNRLRGRRRDRRRHCSVHARRTDGEPSRPRAVLTRRASAAGAAGSPRPVPPRMGGGYDSRPRGRTRAVAEARCTCRRERPWREQVVVRARIPTASNSKSCGPCRASIGATWSTRP